MVVYYTSVPETSDAAAPFSFNLSSYLTSSYEDMFFAQTESSKASTFVLISTVALMTAAFWKFELLSSLENECL